MTPLHELFCDVATEIVRPNTTTSHSGSVTVGITAHCQHLNVNCPEKPTEVPLFLPLQASGSAIFVAAFVNATTTSKHSSGNLVCSGRNYTILMFSGILFRQVLKELYANKKIAHATHNMYAYRICKEDTKCIIQDCNDDGEARAGSRLLHLLQVFGLKNLMNVFENKGKEISGSMGKLLDRILTCYTYQNIPLRGS
jgi:hypothetical protein